MAISCQNSRDSWTFSCDPQLVLSDSLIGFVYEQIQAPEFDIGQYLNPVLTTDQDADPKPGPETVPTTQHDAEPEPALVTAPTTHHNAEPKPAVYEQIHSPEFDIGQYLNLVTTTDQNADHKPGPEMVLASQHDAEPKPSLVTVLTSHHNAEPTPAVYEQIQAPEFDIGQYLNPVLTTDQNADPKPGQQTLLATQHDAEPKGAQVTVQTTHHDAEPKSAVYEQIQAPESDIGQYLNSVPATDQNADPKPGQEMVLATQHDAESKPAQEKIPANQHDAELKPAQLAVPATHHDTESKLAMTQYNAEPKPAQMMVPTTQYIAELKPVQVMVPTTQYNAEPKPGQMMVPMTQYNAEPKPVQVMVPTTQYNAEPKPGQIMVPMTQYNAEPKPVQVVVPTTQYNAEPKPGQIMVPTTEYNAELNPAQVMVLTTQNNTVPKPAQVPMFNSSHLIAPSMPSLYPDSYNAYAQNSCQANNQFISSPLVQYPQMYNSQFSTASLTNQVHVPYQNPVLPVRTYTGRAHGVMVPAFKPANSQSVAARVRRKKISDKTQELASLIPGGTRMNNAEMLQAAYKYVNFLKAQIGILAMMDSEEAREVPLTVQEYMRSLLGSTNVQEYLSAHGKCLVPKTLVVNLAKEMKSNFVVSRELSRVVESIKDD